VGGKAMDIMRLDKYLKVSRLIKRRTVANEACDAGRIIVNGNVARASYKVKLGDIIEISMGARQLKIKVTGLNEHATKENAGEMYESVS
jgi:ribosomal 50S subunit-recycling heat shock protein